MYHPFALKLLAHVSQEVNKKDGVQETTIEIKDATRLHVREKLRSSSTCLLEIDPVYHTIGIIIFTLINMNSQKVQMLLALNLNVKI